VTRPALLRKMEAQLLEENWTRVREGIEVQRVASPDGSEDTFILCRSTDRRQKPPSTTASNSGWMSVLLDSKPPSCASPGQRTRPRPSS